MRREPWQWLFYGLLAGVAILILVTFLDYGLTWDEEVQRNYGEQVISWYRSGFRDRSALSYLNLNLYGGFFETLAQLATRILPFGVYESRHLVNAAFGLVAIAATYKLGAYVSSSMGGFFSALCLTLTPVFYGFQFNNPKDLPFLTLSLLAFYFILQSYDALPRLPKRLIAKLGISIGLTLGVRVGGLFLFGYLALLWACWFIVQWGLSRRATRELSFSEKAEVVSSPNAEPSTLEVLPPSSVQPSALKTLLRLSLLFALIVVIAWVVMLVWWPWAQAKPLVNPFRALAEATHFDSGLKVFYNGEYVPANDLPRSYLPTWFALTLPEFYFVLLLTGLFFVVRCARRLAITAEYLARFLKIGMVVFAFGFPLAMAIILHSTIYNGLRHFLFVIPLLAVLAGISFAALCQSQANRLIKINVAALVLLSAGSTVVDMMQLHPYQAIYFNRMIAGGLKHAAQRYDSDYWGMSYKEGIEWVIQNYHPNTGEPIRVANCSKKFLTGYFLEKTEETRQRFASVPNTEDSHLFLAISRCHRKRKHQVLYTVERQGTPLMFVIELEAPKPPEAASEGQPVSRDAAPATSPPADRATPKARRRKSPCRSCAATYLQSSTSTDARPVRW